MAISTFDYCSNEPWSKNRQINVPQCWSGHSGEFLQSTYSTALVFRRSPGTAFNGWTTEYGLYTWGVTMARMRSLLRPVMAYVASWSFIRGLGDLGELAGWASERGPLRKV